MNTAILRTTRPLTAGEARDLTDRIRSTAEKLHSLLQEAYDRGAWSALGYASWRDYAVQELSISKSHAYRLLDQARVIAAIQEAAGISPNGEISPLGEITEREARELKPVLDEVTEEIRQRVDAGADPDQVIREVIDEKRQEQREAAADVQFSDAVHGSSTEEEYTPDLVEELEHARDEIRRLVALNESLLSDDLGAEVKKLSEQYARLEGRLNQELTTSREAQRQAKYQGELLKKIRDTLGVRQTQEILPRIRELVGGAP